MMKTLTHSSMQEAKQIGGKAKNLQKLTALGMNVPKWTVVAAEVLFAQLTKGHDATQSETLQVADDILKEIHRFFQLDDQAPRFFAVRSSALDEDGDKASFAGQFESFLYVKADDIAQYILKVWQSAFSKRVADYRKAHGLKEQFGMAVIIQEMVEAEVAGVAFGMNPVNGATEEKVISAVYGLGEGLVSGVLNADTFIYDGEKLESTMAHKVSAFVPDFAKGGLKKVDIAKERQQKPSLSFAQIQEIAEVLALLKQAFGQAQDIEFAYAGGQLYLLQSRPITQSLKQRQPKKEKIIWDNSNIVESYPGVTTPLTFSFIIKMYEAVYTQFSRLMGVKPVEIEANSHVFNNMLGLIHGRVYYNLLSWYQALSLLPGYSLNARFMEKMMGVKERFELNDTRKLSKTKAITRLVGSLFNMLKQLIRLPLERRRFQHFLDEVIAEYHAIDFAACSPTKLMQLYRRFEGILLKEWKAPLTNDFFAMIYFGMLEKLIQKWRIGDNPNLHNDLHCGSKDIISTEPIKRLFELSKLISDDEEAQTFFKTEDKAVIWPALLAGKFPHIYEKVADYLAVFGERCVGELKLETVSYKQEPTQLIGIIQTYVQQGISAKTSSENIEETLRREAELVVKSALRHRPIRHLIFRHVLRMSRSLVSSRENLRYERTRGFGVVRSIFVAMGQQFSAGGIIEHARDIFYLTKEEIFDYISGTARSTKLKETIALRKAEYDQYQQLPQPSERISTYGVVYHQNDFYPSSQSEPFEGDLKGIGCCPGRVKARVRVVLNPQEIHSLEGDILVTSSTDPGWVSLFPTASAILVERGSLLSHSAIVSRELGIPCIVGIEGLLASLKTGDEVEMDGSTGEINTIPS